MTNKKISVKDKEDLNAQIAGVIISETYKMFAAQTKKIDSLLALLETNKNRLNKIEAEINFLKYEIREIKIKLMSLQRTPGQTSVRN